MWKKILCWLLVLIWLIVIFCFSAKNGETSSGQSNGVIIGVLAEGTVVAQKAGIIERNLSQEEINIVLDNFNGVIRKIAHATIYFVLAILIVIALNTRADTFLRNMLIAVILCFLYSITDEYHQTLVAGRTGTFLDCLIDTFGAVAACLTYKGFLKLKDSNKKA